MKRWRVSMTIIAQLEPITKIYSINETELFNTLEVQMQAMGHLVAYREQLNWTNTIETIKLGEENALYSLKKQAAKNDGVMLFYAKWFKQTVYKHIILHPNNNGLYLPFPFDEPITIKINNQSLAIGSSQQLFKELTWLTMSMNKLKGAQDVVNYWNNYKYACTESIEHSTPIILTTVATES